MRRAWLLSLVFVAAQGCSITTAPANAEVRPGPTGSLDLTLPLKDKSVRFAVIGDTGSGGSAQYEIGTEMAAWRAKFPFELVIMLGDNIYGADSPADYKKKFEDPYKPLLDAGVKFYASLGNHDNANQVSYKLFNMGGKQYYSFKSGPVKFFVLDSNYLDKVQLGWIEKELEGKEDWKIAYFHHPLYSSGKFHGPSVDKRKVLEPMFVKNHVNVVFSGHEHFYERIKPQQGIFYFISGAGGQLRPKNIITTTGITEKGFDGDFHFMLVEVTGDELHFQVISRVGRTVDSGVIRRATEASQP